MKRVIRWNLCRSHLWLKAVREWAMQLSKGGASHDEKAPRKDQRGACSPEVSAEFYWVPSSSLFGNDHTIFLLWSRNMMNYITEFPNVESSLHLCMSLTRLWLLNCFEYHWIYFVGFGRIHLWNCPSLVLSWRGGWVVIPSFLFLFCPLMVSSLFGFSGSSESAW